MVSVGLVTLVIHLMFGALLTSVNFSAPILPAFSSAGFPGQTSTTCGLSAASAGTAEQSRNGNAPTKRFIVGSRKEWICHTFRPSPRHLQSRQRSFARTEFVNSQPESLQHGNEEIRERWAVLRIEGEVLAVLESAARQQHGQVLARVAVPTAQVAAEHHHCAVEYRGRVFLRFFQLGE